MVRLLIKHNATEIRLIALSSFILTSPGSLSECQDAVMDAEGGRGLGRNQNPSEDWIPWLGGLVFRHPPLQEPFVLTSTVSAVMCQRSSSIELLEINKTEKMSF